MSNQDTRTVYNQHASEWIEWAQAIPEPAQESLQAFSTHLPPGGKVLDIGCGTGIYSEWFVEHGYKVIACDISDELVAYVQHAYPKMNVVRGEIYDIDVGGFDGIWCYLVFHHIKSSEQRRFMRAITDKLSTGGVCCLTTAISAVANDSVCSNGSIKVISTEERMERLFAGNGLYIEHSSRWPNGMVEYILMKK